MTMINIQGMEFPSGGAVVLSTPQPARVIKSIF
jgi:hypothetical protein